MSGAAADTAQLALLIVLYRPFALQLTRRRMRRLIPAATDGTKDRQARMPFGNTRAVFGLLLPKGRWSD